MQRDWDAEMHEEDEVDDDQLTGQGPEVTTGGTSVQSILASLFALQSSRGGQASGISVQDLSRLLNGRTLQRSGLQLYAADEDDDDDYIDEDDDDHPHYRRLRTGGPKQWFEPVKEPQKAGLELMQSGEFGTIAAKTGPHRAEKNAARHLRQRLCTARPTIYKADVARDLIPNSNGTSVAIYDHNVYTAQYSHDSSFFYTCSQDFRLNVFDTKAPPQQKHGRRQLSTTYDRDNSGLKTNMKISRSIQGIDGRWTITDANLSPDNERLIYSSITSTVYMTSIRDEVPIQIPIHFADPPTRNRRQNFWGYSDEDSFGIYSTRFSADGNEVIAGGRGEIFVYDLLANRRTVRISAHKDDVNSCCWADTASGNVLVSASDDAYLKVWDRRSLGSSQKPSGILAGHTEGITYVSAKGDGRYVISNGKDQALRLWDLRKMRSSEEVNCERNIYKLGNFDYRYPPYPKPKVAAHPKDCSVMTYRGHSVLRTLIRCHFSPAETTGSQYLYSGSADGKIHIWSLDGRVVQVLDRSYTLPFTFDPSAREPQTVGGKRSQFCVRDVSWHSQEPVLMSAAWDDGRGGSVLARHEWKGLGKLPGALEDWAEKERQEASESSPRRSTRLARQESRRQRRVPGSWEDEDDEDV